MTPWSKFPNSLSSIKTRGKRNISKCKSLNVEMNVNIKIHRTAEAGCEYN
jgi:hypothetical protein